MTLAEVLFFSNVIDLFQCTDKRNTDRVTNNFYLLVFNDCLKDNERQIKEHENMSNQEGKVSRETRGHIF